MPDASIVAGEEPAGASSAQPRRRVEGVDVARGVASLVMIQGHAYDGWVTEADKASVAYAFTRLLGSLPLPAFLVLAGAAVALRVEAAIARGEDAGAVRRGLTRRGLTVLAFGYLASGAYALMDGHRGLPTLLRADVLHVIGLSIVALAQLGVRGRGAPSRPTLAGAALGLAIVPTLACPWLSPLGARVDGPLRYALALFVDVEGVTLMPFVPLAAWLAIGAAAGLALTRAGRGAPPSRAGAGAMFFAALSAGALVVAVLAARGTTLLVEALGGSLTRAHPAVWLNVIDLAARGLLVLGVAGLATPWLPAAARRAVVRLGQGSLVAYVFHIPFCYGALGAPIQGELDMGQATLAVVALMGVSFLVVWGRDALVGRLRRG